ncbi:MAG: hypothetical protein ABW039_07210 [Sphingobium sp.]
MSDEPEQRSLLDVIRARSGVLIAAIGLVAWMAMLWFMFGDVL